MESLVAFTTVFPITSIFLEFEILTAEEPLDVFRFVIVFPETITLSDPNLTQTKASAAELLFTRLLVIIKSRHGVVPPISITSVPSISLPV